MSDRRLQYFRPEATELMDAVGRGLLALERGDPEPGLVAAALRSLHTLKGAARVARQPEIATAAHAMEELLGPYRDAAGSVPSAALAGSLAHAESIRARIAQLGAVDRATGAAASPASDAAPASEPASARGPIESAVDSVRVPVSTLEELLSRTAEAAVFVQSAQEELRRLDDIGIDVAQLVAGVDDERVSARMEEVQRAIRSVSRDLDDRLERVRHEVGRARETTRRLRMVEVGSLFPALERAVADAARDAGVRVGVTTRGGDSRVDATVLAGLQEALLHLVRNAVAHGIETSGDRLSSGKGANGAIHLTVLPSGDRLRVTCADDGRGIDAEALRERAVALGRLTPADAGAASREELLGLALLGGVTTAKRVTQVAGRGVGLEIVRETLAQLHGTISLASEPGRGTEVAITVPVSVASVDALLVRAGDRLVGLPVRSLLQILRLDDSEIDRTAGGGSISWDGAAIPFASLAALLTGASDRRNGSTVVAVLRAGAHRLALGLEGICGFEPLVLRSLPKLAGSAPAVMGATFDATGTPQIVLEPQGLIALMARQRGLPVPPPAARTPPVLVIDDSITSRMVEQSILESAGYEVDTAASAEEELERAQARRYGLFIVDVEMPGMNGFEFVSRTRQDPNQSAVPGILVTSLADDENRRRGMRTRTS